MSILWRIGWILHAPNAFHLDGSLGNQLTVCALDGSGGDRSLDARAGCTKIRRRGWATWNVVTRTGPERMGVCTLKWKVFVLMPIARSPSSPAMFGGDHFRMPRSW